ncbi:macro domain-containing protein [Acidilobus sp.]|uniref:macro domain-containing protein n=1 Tax=Acidilobus sp. TaxID=1872109 RepID=UPI003D055332
MLAVRYGQVTIIVKLGDITDEEAEAIVNPANSYLIMGGGVAGAIRRKGGKVIEDEAISKAPVDIGDAVATTAGKLKAKYVIHAPTMKEPASLTNETNVRLATRAALKVARQLNVNSIAFPGMGTGVGGVPFTVAANAMVDEIKKFIDVNGPPPFKIILVAIDEGLYEAFSAAVSSYLGSRGI